MFIALETERLRKSVSLVMFVPGEHYNTCYYKWCFAFLQVRRVEGSMDFSCALDGSCESIKCQVKSTERRELQCGSKLFPTKSSPKSLPLIGTMPSYKILNSATNLASLTVFQACFPASTYPWSSTDSSYLPPLCVYFQTKPDTVRCPYH